MSSTVYPPEVFTIPVSYIGKPWFQMIKYLASLLKGEGQKSGTSLAVPSFPTFFHCITQTLVLDGEFPLLWFLQDSCEWRRWKSHNIEQETRAQRETKRSETWTSRKFKTEILPSPSAEFAIFYKKKSLLGKTHSTPDTFPRLSWSWD